MNCTGCTTPNATYEYRGRLFCNENCCTCFVSAAGDGWLESLKESEIEAAIDDHLANDGWEELAKYAESYGRYHIEKWYDGDPGKVADGPRKLIKLACRVLGKTP